MVGFLLSSRISVFMKLKGDVNMYYVLHDSINLDLKATPVHIPQTTLMMNTQRGRKVSIGHHLSVIL